MAAILVTMGLIPVLLAVSAPYSDADNSYSTDEHHKFAVTFRIPDVSNCDHYLIEFGDGDSIDSSVDDTSSVTAVYDSASGTWTYTVMHEYPEVPGTYTMEFTAYNSDDDSATSGLNVRLLGYPVVSFETNGGSAIDPITVPNGPSNGGVSWDNYYTCAAAPADPTKDGYVFSGWYSDSSLQYEWDWDYVVTGDMTLYASWSEAAEEYTITFYVDGSEYDVSVFTAGDAIILPEEPSKDGYSFIGWKGYEEGMKATCNRGFCALWESIEPVSYTVTYTVAGVVYSGYVPAGSAVDFEAPEREGYTFEGWYADEELTIPLESVGVGSDMEIYPKYSGDSDDGPDTIAVAVPAAVAIAGMGAAVIGFRSKTSVVFIVGSFATMMGIGVLAACYAGVLR